MSETSLPTPVSQIPPSAMQTRAKRPPRPIALSDLTEDLLWPRLFRVVPLALRPERLGIALFTILLCSLVARGMKNIVGADAWNQLAPSFASALEEGSLRTAEWSIGGLLVAIEGWFSRGWWPLMREHPLSLSACLVALAAILAVGGGAIARACAVEFSHGVVSPWTRTLGFAVSRTLALTTTLLAPLIVAGLICGGMAIGGWVLLNWPVVNILGSLLYIFFLLGGMIAVLLLFAYAIGGWMAVPAVVCEGTDAIDGLQRMYAYVVARPLRLILYLALGFAQIALGVTVFGTIAWWCVRLTGASAGALVGPPASDILGSLAYGPPPPTEGTWTGAAHILSFWAAIPGAIVGAFALSGIVSTSTVVYLLMRRLVDGQDETELWMPGVIGGTTVLSSTVPMNAGSDEDDD